MDLMDVQRKRGSGDYPVTVESSLASWEVFLFRPWCTAASGGASAARSLVGSEIIGSSLHWNVASADRLHGILSASASICASAEAQGFLRSHSVRLFLFSD